MKKNSRFKKIVLFYSIFLLILMIASSIYVYVSLKGYENNQPLNYINNVVNEAKYNPTKYFKVKKEHIESYKDVLKSSKITITEEENDYVVKADEIPILNVKLNKGKKVTKLGLLNYQILSTKEITPVSENGAYYYVVKIPSTFTLKVNDEKYTKVSEKEDYVDFEDIDNELLPKTHIYKLTNFTKKPKIEIFNNKNELIKYTKDGNTITNYDFYKTDDYQKNIKEPLNILEFAKNWSLYFTNDLRGTRGGLDVLKENLIPDSKMMSTAETWLKSIDRQFVSKHILANPAFSNESVSDCHIYSDEAFSCIVKLDKNLLVGRARTPQTDQLNDRMYFVYDNGWKFIEMRVNLD